MSDAELERVARGGARASRKTGAPRPVDGTDGRFRDNFERVSWPSRRSGRGSLPRRREARERPGVSSAKRLGAHGCASGTHARAPAAPIGAGVVGCGYWGPNLARNLAEVPEFELRAVRPRPRAAALARAPSPRREDLPRLRHDARRRVDRGRRHHHAAGNPLPARRCGRCRPASTCWSRSRWRRASADGRELAALRASRRLVLMPGHTFIYSPAVNTVRDLIRGGVVGDIHFVTSSRMNLGKYQRDGVVCDLAPHDLSILLYWLEQPVVEVAASGSLRVPPGRSRDGLPDAHLRRRDRGQRAALVAGAAQGPPDDRRRAQAHGPVRRHRLRRTGAGVRPRAWTTDRPRASASTSSSTARATS